MFKDSDTFSSFSVDDVPAANEFYEKTLGLDVTDDNGLLFLKLGGGGTVVVYPKGEAHEPASFTVLGFQVHGHRCSRRRTGIQGHHIRALRRIRPGREGVARDKMGAIAWFTDPARNVFAVLTLRRAAPFAVAGLPLLEGHRSAGGTINGDKQAAGNRSWRCHARGDDPAGHPPAMGLSLGRVDWIGNRRGYR